MLDAGKVKPSAFVDLHGLVLSHEHEILVLQPMPVVIMILSQSVVVRLHGYSHAP